MELTQMIAVVVAIVSGAAVVQTIARGMTVRIQRRDHPEQVLARRFAAGEIDEHDYLLRLDVLREGRELTP